MTTQKTIQEWANEWMSKYCESHEIARITKQSSRIDKIKRIFGI